ncbi:MAG: homocysteine S-methyltransferase family protein [Christensenellales bacterium]
MRNDFRNILKKKTFILDGATGTNLMRLGLHGCPEAWALANPEALIDLQRRYVRAGAQAVLTCTLGGTRHKLSEYGLSDKAADMNRRLAALTREAVGGDVFVGGDVGPTGLFVEPFGELPFEEAVAGFAEQIGALAEAGVDFILIETMLDLQEARAALIAARETCSLPVLVSMTFERGGHTLTGTDARTALITLQSLGADAVGCNCSTGPQEMLALVQDMRPYARVPIVVKPNAGMPVLKDGATRFDMDADEFVFWMLRLYEAGASVLGGCCGTTPGHIAALSGQLAGQPRPARRTEPFSALTSSTRTQLVGGPVCVVGERINPTGKKALQAAFKAGNMEKAVELGQQQQAAGAHVLDVNVGMAGVNEADLLKKAVLTLSAALPLPLSIDTADPSALEAALRVYPGRALINSIPAGGEDLEERLKLAKKYGAMFILLPLGQSIPATAPERLVLVDQAVTIAQRLGIPKESIVVDGLVMAVSSAPQAAVETMRVVRACSKRSLHTILGISNVSFGLPEREWLNAALLAMAVENGLDMAICDPGNRSLHALRLSCDLLKGNDPDAQRYVAAMAAADAPAAPVREGVYGAVLTGDAHAITGLVKKALHTADARAIIDGEIIPALNEVGDLFETGAYFLPQLMRSAQAVQAAFVLLEPRLAACETKARPGTVVLATVKGDIHDIGKNIVGMLLKSHGFAVHDLGKDVPAQRIVETAKRENADIIGLSALLTTTTEQMRAVIALARENGLKSRIMVGGAAVTEEYARAIGADRYGKDANAAVAAAKQLMEAGASG